jgi:outer membrane cobalamin receptor
MTRMKHSSRFISQWCSVFTGFSSVGIAVAQTPDLLPEMVVLAERSESGALIAEWERDDLAAAAPRTIDELLSREPSFSLYRRQSSVFGNPTSAGVSLRNTGATAASRTLVLLDGIPQNDPFGGWVHWARYDAAALDSIRIVPSSRSAVWGNQSPAGVIQMAGRAPFDNSHTVRAGGGSQGSFGGSVFSQSTDAEKQASVAFSAFGFQTDGFHALDASQRGPVDEKLHTDLWGASLRGAWLAAPGLTIEPMVSYYTEDRGNGTAIAGNSTESIDLALRLTSDDGDRSWQVLAYHQRREFESKFASVDATRTTETLALDQYDVPGLGTGGAFTMRWHGDDAWDITAGADVRFLTGETHENAGTFRNRVAGGDQAFEGIFANAGYRIDGATRIDAGGRLDFWQLHDGRRVETSLTDGSPLRDDRPDDRDGIEPSASIGVTRRLRDDLEARVSTGTAFRLPTLNELYRPFRVRDDIVEANADLDPERFVSVEGGIEWKPEESVAFDITVFHHWIHDAIANVPVTDPAEIAALFGVIPPGGSGSQRRNVDEATVTGIEAKAEWQAHERLNLALTGLWTETEFRESESQPLLEGQPFPQAPDLRVIGDIEWNATAALGFFAGAEYGASQYDDALATRRIPEYTSARIGAWFRHRNGLYQIRVENLFDEEIQTGLSSDGLRSHAAPRSLWVGAEWAF